MRIVILFTLMIVILAIDKKEYQPNNETIIKTIVSYMDSCELNTYGNTKLFLESDRIIRTIARENISYNDVYVNLFDCKNTENYISLLGKEKIVDIAIWFYLKTIKRKDFESLYKTHSPEKKEFDFHWHIQHVIEQIEKVNINATITEPLGSNRKCFFENQEYEEKWSYITKLAYRWEKRFPGINKVAVNKLKTLVEEN